MNIHQQEQMLKEIKDRNAFTREVALATGEEVQEFKLVPVEEGDLLGLPVLKPMDRSDAMLTPEESRVYESQCVQAVLSASQASPVASTDGKQF